MGSLGFARIFTVGFYRNAAPTALHRNCGYAGKVNIATSASGSGVNVGILQVSLTPFQMCLRRLQGTQLRMIDAFGRRRPKKFFTARLFQMVRAFYPASE
jgi:hypothetical protein